MSAPRLTTFLLVLAILLGAPSAALAQCAMCREAAAQSGAEKALNLAILVLLIPTLVLFIGVFVYALRRKDEPEPPGIDTPTRPPRARTETVLHLHWLNAKR